MTKQVRRDWQGEMKPEPVPKRGKLCLNLESRENPYPVKLYQTSRHKFAVVYGLQMKEGLSYADAALEFGRCIMHALACDGKLDNAA